MSTKTDKINSEKKRCNVEINVYCDWYERDFGDGFFPTLDVYNDHSLNTEKFITTVNFVYNEEKNIWKQDKGYNIDGLDGNQGKTFIELLNKKGQVNAEKIYNSNTDQIYPK
jgi:hypothetical protein